MTSSLHLSFEICEQRPVNAGQFICLFFIAAVDTIVKYSDSRMYQLCGPL